MATFVLVHGARGGGFSWNKVIPFLEPAMIRDAVVSHAREQLGQEVADYLKLPPGEK